MDVSVPSALRHTTLELLVTIAEEAPGMSRKLRDESGTKGKDPSIHTWVQTVRMITANFLTSCKHRRLRELSTVRLCIHDARTRR
jgi:hypothetical protein